ncbi:hypothetical protein [Methylomonas methanica]|uniref:Uncharacterized protein n=1 Tax=Methylomonas methanica (strain DSM 25384 / MC09) TaxID=857087 RepID=G0A251_METMM|nr:hypothetical protein [Methylomonas methanica]AEG02594.1 hypothetical protein Metme_4243 [Methylomonas methanica MC09]
MDKVLFGDNQFFGVNHMSEEKARAQSMRFRDTQAMIEVLDMAYEAGIRTFMCTTHDRISEVCDYFRKHADSYPGFKFYPGMPYAHKYANAVTDHGIAGTIKRFLPDDGLFDAVVRGGSAVAKKEIDGIATLLIDAEMKMFAGLSTPVIFLQNVVTDFLLGLGMKDAFRIFADHIKTKYNAEPGFFSMNMPRLLDVLEEVGVENPIVCTNINKIGFRMSGGIDLYQETLAHRQFRPIAMSVLASGAIPPREAIEYVCKLPKLQSIVFGASGRGNIRQTKALIDEFMAARQE